MEFETFRRELTKKYDEINETSVIKIDIPSDQDILKIFLSKMVFLEYEMKVERMKRQ